MPATREAVLVEPAAQESGSGNWEERLVVGLDVPEFRWCQRNDTRRATAGGDTLVSEVAIGRLETAPLIEGHHVEHAVHADRRARSQSLKQRVPAPMPKGGAEA